MLFQMYVSNIYKAGNQMYALQELKEIQKWAGGTSLGSQDKILKGIKQTNKKPHDNLRSRQRESQKKKKKTKKPGMPKKCTKQKRECPGVSALQIQRGPTRQGHQHPQTLETRRCELGRAFLLK